MLTLHRTWLGIALALLIAFPVMTRAQSAGARDYLNTPVYDARFFLDLVNSTSGTTASQSDVPLPNNDVVVRTGVLSLLYSFPLAGQYGGVALSVGRATVEVPGPSGDSRTSGFTDPSLTFHANIFGAPALRPEEYLSATPQTYLSFHLTVHAPLGSYDRSSPVNIGANRWAFTPVFNLDITRDEGVSWIDLYAGARFYTNNNAYLGDSQLSQDPLGSLTAHYSHNFGKLWWAAIGVVYERGGQTYINNVPQHDAARAFLPTAAISRAFGKFRLILSLDDTASTPDSPPKNWSLTLRIAGPLFW